MGSDYEVLRGYVIGSGSDSNQQKAPEGQVRLEITHSVLSDDTLGANNYKNFHLNLTVKEFKEKLYRFVGTEPKYMTLVIREQNKITEIKKLDDEEKTLEQYQIQDGLNVHIIDNDPNNYISELQDTSKVEKATMTDEEYNKREGTYKKWIEEQQKSNTNTSTATTATTSTPEVTIKVGDRCQVTSDDPNNYDIRLGTVSYSGTTEFSSGHWIGVTLDLPLGKNDGSVKGKRYFECSPKYGCFVKPSNVIVGDFPEEEI
ncbi:hypothetical protein CYY_002220 [Polysphondylium violaceum]|uniref:Tubulin folding cofactor B n=1 Tax=Polysphondylium violaceum TaxID=133409 RepID=A0A8J4PZI9_9MYCE|nr:hypothetical protein CYY_002220 [Polysphondylium violaceum]